MVNDATTITANSPTGNRHGQCDRHHPDWHLAPISAADQFNYTVVVAPDRHRHQPDQRSGGRRPLLVTITGTGFTGATAVDFGTTAATGLVVVNDTTITTPIAPPEPPPST